AEVKRAPPATKAAAEQKRKTTEAALATAKKAAEMPGETYTPIPGAVRSAESNLDSRPKNGPFPDTSTGRRTALANWIASKENRYFWRMNPVRMEAQTIRDSLLHLAGDLDLTQGGPPVPMAAQEASRRRSLYFFHSHNEHNKLLDIFDNANVLECYRRSESIVPQQALALWNSKLALTMAGKINDALHTRLGDADDAKFVTAAFEMILGTSPTKDELAT